VAQILFEEAGVPALFLAKDAALACYGCGRVTGTVVDVGYSGTTVSPVYDGYVEARGIRRSPVGLQAVDELILDQLDQLYGATTTGGDGADPRNNSKKTVTSGHEGRKVPPRYQVAEPCVVRSADIYRAARMQLAVDCREWGAGAAINTALLGGALSGSAVAAAAGPADASSSGATFHAPHKSFELPDGTVLDIPSSSRFGAAAYLFGCADPPALIDAAGTAASRRRDECLQSTRKAVSETIRIWSKSSEDEQVGEGNDTDMPNAREGEDEYTDGAAAGISKRRAKRDSPVKALSSASQPSKGTAEAAAAEAAARHRRRFHKALLRRACLPHYRTYLDQYLTSAPVPSMVCDAAYRCDRDQQVALLGNVVLCGGGACLGPTDQAVPDFVKEKLEGLIHSHTPGFRVKVLTPGGVQERSVLSWLGGSILASMGTFHDMWITKAEYEEWGSAIVNRKCP
jgi:actin-related protein